MKKKLLDTPSKMLIFLDLVFAFLISLSGEFDGILSTIVYILAFLIPIFVGLILTEDGKNTFAYLDNFKILPSLPLFAPTLLSVIFISFITSSLIFAITGKTSVTDLGDSLPLAILIHAVLPAIFEEALFRYIPMRVYGDKNPFILILSSAALFSLIHHSFYAFLYAFVAGIAFMVIDLICGSVWPSVILHFLNNLLSILWYFNSDFKAFPIVLFITLAVLTAISYIVVRIKREFYESKIVPLIKREDKKIKIPIEAWILIIPMLLVAVMELFL